MMFIRGLGRVQFSGMIAVWVACMIVSSTVIVRVCVVVFAVSLLVMRRERYVTQGVLVEDDMS